MSAQIGAGAPNEATAAAMPDRSGWVAHNVYQAVVDRVDSLLAELQRRAPEAYEAARVDVMERGNLTPYFARKVAQLGLLQMLTPASASSPKGNQA